MSWVRTFEDVLVGIALLNLTISVVIVRSESLTVRQKLAQVLIVWLIPPLGGMLIGMFMWTQRGRAPATGYRPIPHESTRHIEEAVNHAAPPAWYPDNSS